jgi:hypothetical protein
VGGTPQKENAPAGFKNPQGRVKSAFAEIVYFGKYFF